MNINDFRQQYPQYNDMSDEQLSGALYSKFGQGQDIGQWNNQFLGQVEGDQSGNAIQSGADAYSGLVNKALQGATFGFSDEGLAGLYSGMDWVANKVGLNDTPYDYDQWLEKNRKQLTDTSEALPYTAGATEMLGSFAVPGLGWAKGAKSIGGKILKGATEGAVTSGIYGAGQAEGDLQDRLTNALSSGSIGMLVGGGIPFLGSRLSKLKDLGKAEQMRATGIGQRDLLKGADEPISAFEREATGKFPIENAFNRLQDAGEFNPVKSGTLDPNKLTSKSLDSVRQLAREVNDIIEPASKSLKEVLPKRGYMTTVNNTISKLKSNEQEEAIAYVNEYLRNMRKKGKVSLADLQKEKVNIYEARYDTNSNAWKSQIDKAIASDFKKIIEKKVDFLAQKGKLPKNQAGKIKKLNQQIGDWKKLQPVFMREEGKGLKGVAETILPALRTSGGFGMPTLAALMAGAGTGSAAAIPLLFLALQRPSVRYGMGEAFQKLGSAGDSLTSADLSWLPKAIEGQRD